MLWPRLRRPLSLVSTGALAAGIALAPMTAHAEPEPNNTQASATPLGIDLTGTAASLSSASDVDWFTFTARSTHRHTVEVYNATTASLCLGSYSSSGARTGQSCVGSGHTVARLEVPATAGGKQWLRVNQAQGRTGTYRIRVLPPAGQGRWGKDSEPNNTFLTASPLVSGRWTSMAVDFPQRQFVLDTPDVDMVRLQTTPGVSYRWTTAYLSRFLRRDLLVRVYDTSGRLLARQSCAASGSACHNLTVTATGPAMYALFTTSNRASSGGFGVCATVSGRTCLPTGQVGDWNDDGVVDLRYVSGSDTFLRSRMLWGSTYSAESIVGRGWWRYSWLQNTVDLTGDGLSDIVGRRDDGTLWLFPADGIGGWATPRQIGQGWGAMSMMVVTGDFTGDGFPELLARTPEGRLLRWSFTRDARLVNRTQIGHGWNMIRLATAMTDLSGDGWPDLLTVTTTGNMRRYALRGGRVVGTAWVGSGWGSTRLLSAPGDSTGDNRRDLVALRTDGSLWSYSPQGTRFSAVRMGAGFGAVRIIL